MSTLRQYGFRGAAYGIAAWTAYALAEFVFSSVLFAFTRPYAVFTTWHWRLTALLLGAFLLSGAVAGGIMGTVVYFLRRARLLPDDNDTALVESAATLSVLLFFIGGIVSSPRSISGWYSLLAASLCLSGLAVAGMLAPRWRLRTGFLLNPWMASGLLLGLGQEHVLLTMGVADQLGARTGFWALVLGCILIVTAVGSVVLGWWLRPRLASHWVSRWAYLAAGPSAAVLLIVVSSWLAVRPPPVQAAITPNPTGTNVLLIVMDTVHADHLSVYGYDRKTTPHLEQLAGDSVIYPRAVSASDFTLTSHASLFTGMYPSWHGSYCQPPEATYGRQLAQDYPTIAELLSRQGYRTMGVAANLYLRAYFGLERGFATFEIPRPVPVLTAENWYFLRRNVRRLLSYGFDTSEFDRLYSRSEDIDQAFYSALERHQGSAPFFAFLNFMDAHYPYVPPQPFDSDFPGKESHLTQDDLDRQQVQISNGGEIPPTYRPHSISQYDGGIEYMDAQIGNLIAWLKQSNLYDRTMIIVTSDHGEAFGERHRVGHANSPYQNLLHVGLLIKYPNSEQKGVVNDPVSVIDVAPTILDTLGVTVPAMMQGRSLRHGAPGQRELFGETFPCPVLHPPECPNGCTARAVYSWPYKFITSTSGKRELFDLSMDPAETHDLSASLGPLAKQLNSDLREWMKTAPARSRQKLQLDKESVQRLKSLGYAQ